MTGRPTGRPRLSIRTCECGYAPSHMSHLKRHIAVCKVLRMNNESDYVAAKNAEIERLSQQLAEKDERIRTLELMLGHQLLQLKQDLKETKKRKDNYASKSAIRKKRTEPERRQIAQRQGWKCANPDGGCLLTVELAEYDVDHVVPIWKGGSDEPENLQALCPACHRRKTDRERADIVSGEVSKEMLE